jgi:exopolysaccharide biosynthesis protein
LQVTNRTAVAINADKQLMWLVVTKTDMNLPELATFIANKTNAESAVNLDGGGSTTLWISGKGVVNVPASAQRTVCNHFGILSGG